MLRQLLVTERPDAIVLITDPRQFTWLWEVEDEIHQICPIAYWHVWDNDPYPKFNEVWYESTDLINCLSHKTFELVNPHFPDKTHYIPHAFPRDMYKPLPKDLVKQIRTQHFGPRADWQIGLWINRNATRKMPSDVLTCFKEHLDNLEKEKGHRNALLIMHTDPNDVEGPNLLAVTEMLGLQPHVWFSTQKLDFNDMNVLHNITDYVINISKAEGFGLATMVGLMTGKPIIAHKTGGMTRQVIDWRDGTSHGVAVDPAVRMMVGSQLVPYIHDDHVDKSQVTKAFMTLYNMTDTETFCKCGKLARMSSIRFSTVKSELFAGDLATKTMTSSK
jgi:glycosyltransferase involved in cell wall biosynthesis